MEATPPAPPASAHVVSGSSSSSTVSGKGVEEPSESMEQQHHQQQQQQAELLKSSSLSISATPFIPRSSPDAQSNTKDTPSKADSSSTGSPVISISSQVVSTGGYPTGRPVSSVGPPPLLVAPPSAPRMPLSLPPPTAAVQQRRDGQAYQIISPQVEQQAGSTPAVLHRQVTGERRATPKDLAHLKETSHYRGHRPDAAMVASMTTGLEMQARHLQQTQSPFSGSLFSLPGSVTGVGPGMPPLVGRSKLPAGSGVGGGGGGGGEPVTRTMSHGHMREAMKAMQAGTAANKRPLLPTPPVPSPPTHASVLPPRIPPTWTSPRGAHPAHTAQQALYSEQQQQQRSLAGYNAGTGRALLGAAATYHRN